MPGMSGIELLPPPGASPEMRRLLVSGHADFDSALNAINEVGVDRLLTKPWESTSCAARFTARRASRACSGTTGA